MENISLEDVTLERNSNYEWKQVKGFEGIYDLRSDGLLYSHPRKNTKGGYRYGIGVKHLQHSLTKNSEHTVIGAHILVYETFVGEIPKGYVVHHINGNPKDNRVENLCLMKDNEHRKMHCKENNKKMTKESAKITSKPVLQYTLDGEFVAEYPSAKEAERQTGVHCQRISECCNKVMFKGKNGKKYVYKSAGGYIWKFKNIS